MKTGADSRGPGKHVREFGLYSNYKGKPLKDFKHVNDVI